MRVMGAEPRLELDHLVELVVGQLGAQGVDRLQQIFAALGAGDRIVGETLRQRGSLLSVPGVDALGPNGGFATASSASVKSRHASS